MPCHASCTPRFAFARHRLDCQARRGSGYKRGPVPRVACAAAQCFWHALSRTQHAPTRRLARHGQGYQARRGSGYERGPVPRRTRDGSSALRPRRQDVLQTRPEHGRNRPAGRQDLCSRHWGKLGLAAQEGRTRKRQRAHNKRAGLAPRSKLRAPGRGGPWLWDEPDGAAPRSKGWPVIGTAP